MSNWLDEIKVDLVLIRSHTLQPKWYKALKVVLLVGFLVGYGCLFGLARTAAFLVSFLLLSLVVHLTYRVKTQRWQRSWLDFVVAEEHGKLVAQSIGGATMRQLCSTPFSPCSSARRCRWAERR